MKRTKPHEDKSSVKKCKTTSTQVKRKRSPEPEQLKNNDESHETKYCSRDLCKRQFRRIHLNRGYFFSEEVDYIC